MRPLILLGCGYIGLALARRELVRGRRIHALVRTEAKAALLRELGFADAVAGDAADPAAHRTLPYADADIVYSISSGGGDDAAYRRAYAEGMATTLAAAKAAGGAATLVYTSSTGVYPQSGGVTVNESSPVGGDVRGDILVETECLALNAAGSATARSVVLRLGGLYGPGRHYMLDTLRRGDTRFAGRGDFRVNYLHRDDAVSAILAALEKPAPTRAATYNLVDGNPAPKEAIAAYLAERLGLPAPTFDATITTARAARRGTGSPDRLVDGAAFRRDFGWTLSYPDFKAGYAAILAGDA